MSDISGKAVSSRMMIDFGSSPLSSEYITKAVMEVFQPVGFGGVLVALTVVVRDWEDISGEERSRLMGKC